MKLSVINCRLIFPYFVIFPAGPHLVEEVNEQSVDSWNWICTRNSCKLIIILWTNSFLLLLITEFNQSRFTGPADHWTPGRHSNARNVHLHTPSDIKYAWGGEATYLVFNCHRDRCFISSTRDLSSVHHVAYRETRRNIMLSITSRSSRIRTEILS